MNSRPAIWSFKQQETFRANASQPGRMCGMQPIGKFSGGRGKSFLHHRACAFTLLELLVTVAILAILAALLLPALSRAYRAAVVLACPIAYVGTDGSVWISDPSGSRQLRVTKLPANGGRVQWSPNGKYISFEHSTNIVIANPVNERFRTVPYVNGHTWVSGSLIQGTVYLGGYNELWRVDVHTGEMWCWKPKLRTGHVEAHYSPYLSDGFIVCDAPHLWTPLMDVVVRDQEWNLRHVIWRDPGGNIADLNARLDPLTGETVAWTRARGPGANNPPNFVALKPIDDTPEAPPMALGMNFDSVGFCDWTARGDLLVIVRQNGVRQLAIMNLKGDLVHTNVARNGLMGESETAAAAWRHHRHW